jgi:DNA-binding transcriptional LysR family regulator
LAAELIECRRMASLTCGRARAGIGHAVLTCYLGDVDPGLVRATGGPVTELTRELWIVIHADLRKTARVRAFFDIVGEGLVARNSLFGGNRGA